MKFFVIMFSLQFIYIYGQKDTTISPFDFTVDGAGNTKILFVHQNYSENKGKIKGIQKYFLKNINTNSIELIDSGYLLKEKYNSASYEKNLNSNYKFSKFDEEEYFWINKTYPIQSYKILSSKRGVLFTTSQKILHLVLSENNPKKIYAFYERDSLLISNNSGDSWFTRKMNSDSLTGLGFIGMSPFDEGMVFAFDSEKRLLRSTDTCKTFNVVDDSCIWNTVTDIEFDVNMNHIVLQKYIFDSYQEGHIFFYYSKFYVSDSMGKENSWNELKFSDSLNHNLFSIEASSKNSGKWFYSYENKLFESIDYGASFELVKKFPSTIKGISINQSNDEIFCNTENSLFKVLTDTLIPLVSFGKNFTLNYYPLEIGNEWYYQSVIRSYAKIERANYKIEVVGDTVLSNGIKYYKLNKVLMPTHRLVNIYWERVDSTTGKLYRKIEKDKAEKLILDLTKRQWELFKFYDAEDNEIYECSLGEIKLENIFDKTSWTRSYRTGTKGIYDAQSLDEFQLVNGVGFYSFGESFDFGTKYTQLTGCVIGGQIFGDTVLVDINSYDKVLINNKFALTQNYPNPFNPSTTIEYSIPAKVKSERGKVSFIPSGVEGEKVKLVVYDVLGRKVKTLVNKVHAPGNYTVQFNGNNLNSGVYFYQLKAGDFVQTRKMLLLK